MTTPAATENSWRIPIQTVLVLLGNLVAIFFAWTALSSSVSSLEAQMTNVMASSTEVSALKAEIAGLRQAVYANLEHQKEIREVTSKSMEDLRSRVRELEMKGKGQPNAGGD